MRGQSHAAASGAKPQWIRAGGSKTGVILEDNRTLESYGFGYSMGPWEVRDARARARSGVSLALALRMRAFQAAQSVHVADRRGKSQTLSPQYLWADSEENQAKLQEELERVRNHRM